MQKCKAAMDTALLGSARYTDSTNHCYCHRIGDVRHLLRFVPVRFRAFQRLMTSARSSEDEA